MSVVPVIYDKPKQDLKPLLERAGHCVNLSISYQAEAFKLNIF